LRNQRKAVVRAAKSDGPERFGTGIFREGLTVYRFFKDPRHADALVAGRVWLSTLASCRHYEGDVQPTPLMPRADMVVGGDPDFGFVARDGAPVDRTIEIKPAADAFVLCVTELLQGDADAGRGDHAVEIRLPHLFRLAVQWRLKARRQDFLGSDVGRVQYEPGAALTPGLVKAPDAYRTQQEIRFVYRVRNTARLEPILLRVPEMVGLCRRVS
jgi:hypothetical protein